MTAFAGSDVITVVILETGHEHKRRSTRAGYAAEFAVDCADCEPILLERHGDQWGISRDAVPLTPDERAAKEELEKRGALDARAMADAIVGRLVGDLTSD